MRNNKVEARIARLRALPYDDYLKTRHWRDLRLKVLARWDGMCEQCGEQPAVEVHHRTYEHRGNERMAELTPLCADCHEAEHKRLGGITEQRHRAAANRRRFVTRSKRA